MRQTVECLVSRFSRQNMNTGRILMLICAALYSSLLISRSTRTGTKKVKKFRKQWAYIGSVLNATVKREKEIAERLIDKSHGILLAIWNMYVV